MICLLPGIAVAFAGLFYYFYGRLRANRQTLGQYVLGYRIVNVTAAKGTPRHARRVLLSFFGLCMWPISIVVALIDRDKAFWWDAVTQTRAVRTVARDTSRQAEVAASQG